VPVGRAAYNEIDAKACAALRQLIAEGTIASGDVLECSIKDLTADDLRDYTQWHFFAGAGIWSVAARDAGWPDGRPLLTASCPCQPYSGAGKQLGADDPRHLWPDLFRIISAARDGGFLPPVLMGEQVAKKAGYGWFDGVRADLATKGIASRTVDIPACAVDAPHERNRLYWIAVADSYQQRGGQQQSERRSEGRTADGRLDAGRSVGDATGDGRGERWPEPIVQRGRNAATGADVQGVDSFRNGSWYADAEWITCHDGKARRAKPGIPMLVDGMAGRSDLWSLAGNSISPVLASEVIKAFLDAEADHATAAPVLGPPPY
jgi:DNA (cytosine-5)-methyltransferase 1